MHSYERIRAEKGQIVNETTNQPITFFDFWELTDANAALLVIMLFGVISYSWVLLCLGLIVSVVVLPIVRRRNKRGVFLHKPFVWFGMSLPGLANSRGERKFSN